MRYLLAAAGLLLLGGAAPPAAMASRAEVDGRGLPRLLAPDLTLVRTLPASASPLDPQGLVDYDTGDAFVLAMGGHRLRYAYFVDGDSHNLLLAFPSGWGFTAGYSETYTETERHQYYETSNLASEEFTKTEDQERQFRLGLGWRREGVSGRVLEVGIGGFYVDRDNGTHQLAISQNGPQYETEAGWNSHNALGFDVTARSLSPLSGLQVALFFSYVNLDPVAKTPLGAGAKRRRASVDVGWRLPTAKADDFMLGFTSSWQTDTDLRVTAPDLAEYITYADETKLGTLGLFMSGEREVLKGFRIRGGIRGLISFRDTESRRWDRAPGYETDDKTDTFKASIDSPTFYLGAGYRWRDLDFEARFRESVNLDVPLIRWSVGMQF
jgi:hypothetical protein